MKNFQSFGLSRELNASLVKMNYSEPTPIQEKAIPLALQGRDILGSAQTGTGKTAAFSIPLVESLLRYPESSALVLTPTRELAKQVLEVIHQLLGYQSPIKTAFIIGGEPMGKQLNQLRNRPRIVVGTPGRVNDHLRRGTLPLSTTNFLVLDETDRMLDMGFGVQLDSILPHLPKKRQTLMFSATLPDSIIRLSTKYLNNPERVSMGATNIVARNIKQEVIRIEQDQKYKELVNQLLERNGSVIIFAKTKYGSERMAKNLRRDGFEADALHGDLRQNKRTSVMNSFRNKKFRILVATDIAARGLDVPHIEHVINYDLPQVAEDYIHRTGRTARAGAEGSALCFVSSQDASKWRAIERLLDPTAAPSQDNRGPQRSHSGKKKAPRRSGFKGRSGGSGQPEKRWEKKRPDRSEHGQRPERKWDKPRSDNNQGNSEGGSKKWDKKKSWDKPRSAEGNGQRSEKRWDKPRATEGNGQRSEKRWDKPRSDNNQNGQRSEKKWDKPRASETGKPVKKWNKKQGGHNSKPGGFKGKPRPNNKGKSSPYRHAA